MSYRLDVRALVADRIVGEVSGCYPSKDKAYERLPEMCRELGRSIGTFVQMSQQFHPAPGCHTSIAIQFMVSENFR